MITEEEKEQLENYMRSLMIVRSDLHDLEKTFSRLNNEVNTAYEKIDGLLDNHTAAQVDT